MSFKYLKAGKAGKMRKTQYFCESSNIFQAQPVGDPGSGCQKLNK